MRQVFAVIFKTRIFLHPHKVQILKNPLQNQLRWFRLQTMRSPKFQKALT